MPQLYRTLFQIGALAALAQSTLAQLTLIDEYRGQTFFDNWIYNASVIDNTTQGNIHYLSRDAANAAELTYINAAGNAVIKVDNTTSGVGDPTFGRNSIKLVSNASYSLGTLYVVDAVHLPYGCSVWPAIWTLSSETLDDEGGEIDIWEGVNNDMNAQYTLHSKDGCTQSNNTQLPYTGDVISTNCFYKANGNQGCAFRDNSTTSYGSEFAQNGGGVFATLWDGNGVQTWFFPRASVPADITAGTPDPSTWGAPAASWPSTTCSMDEYFTDQNIIINITLCGLWAGAADVYAQTCTGLCTDKIADPRNYDTAYFELSSIRTYRSTVTTPTITAEPQSMASSTSGVVAAAKKTSTSDASRNGNTSWLASAILLTFAALL